MVSVRGRTETSKIREGGDSGKKPVVTTAPSSAEAKAFMDIAQKVAGKIESLAAG